MSSFVAREQVGSPLSALAQLGRFLWSLPLLRALLPFCLVLDLAAAAAPAVFRWYMAKLADCTQAPCAPAALPLLGFEIPVFTTAFAGMAIVASLMRIGSWILFEVPGQWSTQGLHRQMMRSLARTRTTYFDEHPSGRLLNRLVSDFDNVRLGAVIWTGDTLNASLELLFNALLVGFVSPWLLFLVPFLAGGYAFIQWNLAPSLNRMREILMVARGQLLHRQTDLIDGSELFALYGKLEVLFGRLSQALREALKTQIAFARLEAWGAFWIGLTGELFSFAVMLALAWAVARGRVDAALAGTIVSALMGLSAVLGWLTLATSYLTVHLVHVRRVLEIVDLPPEEAEEGTLAGASGPTSGAPHPQDIEFVGYTMSYRRDTPLILNGVSLRIPAGSKTAIVGRTGVGKTTLMQALLRMVHVHSGDIRLGGRSIFGSDVAEHRRLFGVIPQQPWLFSGTVRSNLDRTGSLPDALLLSLLDEAGLKLDLDAVVEEGGRNLSPGERQLLSFVRILAAGKPYLFLDEPTSALDPHTDVRIGRLLERHAAGKTLIIIAHRPETIRNCDQVIDLSR